MLDSATTTVAETVKMQGKEHFALRTTPEGATPGSSRHVVAFFITVRLDAGPKYIGNEESED